MIVVSGCPRSGTSLMMDLMRMTFGEDRIIGDKFPQEKNTKVRRRSGDTDMTYAFAEYAAKDVVATALKQLEVSRDLNPNGFWECPFTIRGAGYRPNTAKLIKRIEAEKVPSICKIVSQGLVGTNPRYVSKLIYMLREPTAVAKSQERLRRELNYKDMDGQVRNLWDSMNKISPRMFIEVTLAAAKWLRDNPEVEVHFVEYEKLMSAPRETLLELQAFLGEGDFTDAVSAINPKLNRSSKVTIVHELLEEAEMVYEGMKIQDWYSLEEYSVNRKTLLHRQTWQWHCIRSGTVTQEGICKGCINDTKFRTSLKSAALSRGINWESMPCAFECGYDVDRDEYVSIEDSIKNNHWLEQ